MAPYIKSHGKKTHQTGNQLHRGAAHHTGAAFLTFPCFWHIHIPASILKQRENFRNIQIFMVLNCYLKQNEISLFQFVQRLAVSNFASLSAPFFRLIRKSVCSTMVTYNNWWFIILLYLFRQERDGLRHVPSETFVVPRCLASRKPSGAARA